MRRTPEDGFSGAVMTWFQRGWAAAALATLASLASPAAAQQASYGQYLLVLDDSGSMDDSDPRRLVEMAALAFVGALEDGDQVMLAGLNELASGDGGPSFRSPREILEGRDGPEGARTVSEAHLEQHEGQTPCRAALERARGILESMATAGAPQTLLLLTDGACNGGAVEPAERWLAGVRAHREGRFRFVLLMREGRVRPDPALLELARLTGWTEDATVNFDARALLRAFATVLSFSRGLRYDDGGRVGLERTFAGARTVRVLAIQEQGTPRIALERAERGGATSTLPGGPTFRHPTHGWSLRTAADRASETPYAVRSSSPGSEVLVIPVYGRLRVDAMIAPCGEAPALPWSHERTVRAGQPACAWARLVGDPGETIHPHESFAFQIELCGDETCADATAMQAGADGTFHAQLGSQMPLGRHERSFRASGQGMAVAVNLRRSFSAVAYGVHRVALASAPAQPIQQVSLGVLPGPTSEDVGLIVSGAFSADAHAAVTCEVEGNTAAAECVRCVPTSERVELTDPFTVQLQIEATPFCPALSEDGGRPLPVQMRAVISPDAEIPEHAIPIRATLRYAALTPVRAEVLGGSSAESRLRVPGPVAPTDVTVTVELDADGLEVAPLEATQLQRADEDGTIELGVASTAEDCCSPDVYSGTLVLSAREGPSLRIPLSVEVQDPGFFACYGKRILFWTLILLGLALLIWIVRGFISPARFREGAIFTWAETHEALLRLRDGDEGYRKLARFAETKRAFRRNATLYLGGPGAPLPSLKRLPEDARIVATPGGGAKLFVTGPGVEKFEESSGWTELAPGDYPVASRITLRRGDDTFLQFRR